MADVAAGMGVGYSFVPYPEIIAASVEKMGLDVRSFRVPLTQAVQQVVIPSMQENFSQGGRPTWQSVSEATDLIKGNLGFSDTPLVRTGTLKQNMTYLSLWTIDTEQAAIMDLPDRIAYGGIHQAGSSTTSGRGSNIPARPFAVIQDEDGQAISDIFDAWLDERAAASGW